MSTADRHLSVLERFRSAGALGGGTGRLCEVCVDLAGVTGGGILLMSERRSSGTVCTTDPTSEVLEQLQYVLGEGPCIDAFHHSTPVLEPDLAMPEVVRWVAFAPQAVAAGARAVFGFPLEVGGQRIGALNLYRDSPGRLTRSQHEDALLASGIVAQAILDVQARAPSGQLAPEIAAGGDLRDVVHQASGMISVQLGVCIDEALSRLRAYAFVSGCPLNEAARAVVARELRFDEAADRVGDVGDDDVPAGDR